MYNLEDYIQCSLSINCLRKLSELLKMQLPCFWFLLVPAMFTPPASLVSVVLSSSCGGFFNSLHWEMMKT